MRPIAALLLAFALTAPAALRADWERGTSAFQRGDFETAVAELREVTETHPDYAGGHWFLGHALAKLGHWEEAASHYRRGLELEPDAEPTKLLALARAQLAGGRAEEALDSLDRVDAERLDGETREAWFALLANAAARGTVPERSVARLEQAVREQPEEPELWRALGRVYEQTGRPGEAVGAYEKALHLAPGAGTAELLVHAAFRAARGATGEERAGWYRRAVPAAESLVDGDGSFDNWLLLGEARLGAGDSRGAVAAFEKAAWREPRDPLPDYYLGRTHLDLGDARKALWALQEGMRKHPEEDLARRFHLALGEAWHASGEYRRAADAYRRAGEPERAGLMNEYARIALANKEVERDRQACRERLARLEELARDNRDALQGTPEWRLLQSDIARLQSECGGGA